MLPSPTSPPSPPPNILFLLRFLYPVSLLTATFLSINLQTLPYFVLFLLVHYRPSYSISLSTFPAPTLLALAVYALVASLAHLCLALVIHFDVVNPADTLSVQTLQSLSIPLYSQSVWHPLRLLLPHLIVLITVLLILFVRIPSLHRYQRSRFIIAWFRRRKRHRQRSGPHHRLPDRPRQISQPEQDVLSTPPTLRQRAHSIMYRRGTKESEEERDKNAEQSGHDFASLLTDDDLDLTLTPRKRPPGSPPSLTRFSVFMAGRGGLFWCSMATVLVAVSYSSLFTFVFQAVFSGVVICWAFHIRWLHPRENTMRCLSVIRVFRIYVMLYVLLLTVFQLPWFVKWYNVEYEDDLAQKVLRFIGLVPVNTAAMNGWTYVTALASAIAAYLFTGMLEVALKDVNEAEEYEREHSTGGSGEEGRAWGGDVDELIRERHHKLSYYELQFIQSIMHASSLALLVWALVFPGVFTLPLLVAALVYLGLRKYRKSNLFDYLIPYALGLQMVHYLLIAAVDAFRISDTTNSDVIFMLGFRSLNPQFSVNLIESVAVGLLCMNVSSKRYIEGLERPSEEEQRRQGAGRSIGIDEFVYLSLFSSQSRKRDSLYSPLKLCVDQLALASLYVTGGLDLTALNAVFLVALSAISILQSFGLFRRPKIFAIVWSVVLVYAIFFLLATSTFCRALSSKWDCDLDLAGLKTPDRGQVVGYAATVVLASLQVTFTWAYKATPQVDYAKEFGTWFWQLLRGYFLYAAYAALLFYPLSFPANFLSYGYVFFLFISLAVELILPSLQGSKADVRKTVKKYWLVVILFSCAAMLSRYFVRLHNAEPSLQGWFFGLESNETRKFVVTIGDAVVLIVMSLQGRLFVVDSLIDAQSSKGTSSGAVSGGHEQDELAGFRDTCSEPGDITSVSESQEKMEERRPGHKRHKSVEEYIENELSRAAQQGSALLSSRRPSRTLSKHLLRSHQGLSEDARGRSVSFPQRNASDVMPMHGNDETDEEKRFQNELQQFLNRKRVEQALDMFRNFRKSVPVKQTEKFLQDTYALITLIFRGGLIRYSYVLSACAILAASTWLLGISVFGAVYLILGCILLMVEQPLFLDRRNLNFSSGQRIAKSMPAILLSFSFTLMSAQYIFLIAQVIKTNIKTVITSYIGLEASNDISVLPITLNAMLAHVLVFIAANVQKVAIRWAEHDAKLLRAEEEDLTKVQGHAVEPLQSSSALDSAVPIASVLEGVGEPAQDDLAPRDERRLLIESYPRNWSETRTWKTVSMEATNAGAQGTSSGSDASPHRRLSDSDSTGRSEQDVIVKLYSGLKQFLWDQYVYIAAIFSLLDPFWRDWGFDVTFMYLVVCAVVTTSIFSVIYIGIVVAFGGVRRRKVQHHWHQITLTLVLLVLLQYALTLGFPDDVHENGDKWEHWLLIDRGNNTSERKVSVTFGFIAVICAAITLNSVSEGSRNARYWFRSLNSTESLNSAASTLPRSQDSDLEELAEMASEETELVTENIDTNIQKEYSFDELPMRSADSTPIEAELGRADSQPKVSQFISGLGLPRGATFPSIWGGNTRQQDNQERIDSWLAAVRASPQPDVQKIHPAGLATPHGQGVMTQEGQSDESNGSLTDMKQVFRTNDPKDFTRRPMSFENWVKLSWMRFVAPFVHLYVLGVATVDTNVLSALLLLMSFSFLFQFTNVSAKRIRFMFVRWYVVFVVFLLVIYQAPIEPSDSKWEEILGLFKKENGRGQTFINLMVSLWVFCQILARVYESEDFYYVQKYGEEDAKVRFKRAVHEHNSRKYEKMLDRNKAERSNYARQSRLMRLQALKKSERSVDAFYNVCVVQEVELLRKQADAIDDPKRKFSSHYLPEETPNDGNLPTGLNLIIRKLLRGKRWKQYVNQSISSEAKAFVSRYSAWPVYATMLLAAIANPSLLTIAYPIAVFLYLIVEQPRPPKQAWTFLMAYVCAAIGLKYVLRNPRVLADCEDIPFFVLHREVGPSVRNFEQCAPAAGIGFDIFILLALLGHRAVLYSRGVWDLAMSEEDMVLRSEIRGREIDTPSDMSYTGPSPLSLSAEQKGGIGSPFAQRNTTLRQRAWSAEEQYDDVEHILSQARRDIVGEDPQDTARKGEKPLPGLQSSENSAPSRASTKPTLILPVPLRPVVGGARNILQGDDMSKARSRGAKDLSAPEFWNTRSGIPQLGPAQKSPPKTAPPIPDRSHHREFRRSPSIYDRDGPRHLRRHRTLRVGGWRNEEVAETPEPMTAGQSRIQKSLIQGNIIQEKQKVYAGGSLSLFNAQRKGFFSGIQQYFTRLTRENDHKAVGDYYLLIFMFDFISFVYVMFGFSAIFGDTDSGRSATWWTTNFIETRHLITLLVMFTMIILDRICYLTRSMLGKLVLQYTSVIVYHVVLFLIEDDISTRVATRIFYILRCVYFLLSGLQIRDGFPMYTTAQFLLRNYTTLGIVLFEIYIFVPFLWLTRTLLDWAVLPTSLEIFQYFRFIDIYHWLYRNRAINKSRGGFRRTLGEKRRVFPRVYQGFGLFLLCVIALFTPFIIFSIFNPFFVGRELRDASTHVSLLTFDGPSGTQGTSYPIFSRTSVVGRLDRTSRREMAKEIGVTLDVRERENVFEAQFSAFSDIQWKLFEEDKNELVEALESYASNETSIPPKLSFTLSATTEDRTTFGTDVHDYELGPEEANELANAIGNNNSIALELRSPMPRYLILQSSESVFQSYGSENGEPEICIRLFQQGATFVTMGLCTDKEKCNCNAGAGFESTSEPIGYLLQVAEISALQVGGATILTLYTVILFTIANLLKRMFINMRLLIPYIDMPYTLHLYQLALDVMYARQHQQLEMEEILYNGLIDIYRDQHELARWTGERALKLPEKWWDKSEVDNPFMVYPSFAKSETEPYISRIVE